MTEPTYTITQAQLTKLMNCHLAVARDILTSLKPNSQEPDVVFHGDSWTINGPLEHGSLLYKHQTPTQPADELVEACGRYEAALMAAFPQGAHGEAFEQWNEARKVLAKRDAKAAKPLTKEQVEKGCGDV